MSAESLQKRPIPGKHCCPLYVDDAKANRSAEAARFQRFMIASSCISALLANKPACIYPVLLSTLILLCTSSRLDLFVLFYRYVLRKIIGRDLFPVAEKDARRYLPGNAAEKFVFSVLTSLMFLGLYLHHLHSIFWAVPIAIVAVGVSLAATTGFCTMAVLFRKTRKYLASHI